MGEFPVLESAPRFSGWGIIAPDFFQLAATPPSPTGPTARPWQVLPASRSDHIGPPSQQVERRARPPPSG